MVILFQAGVLYDAMSHCGNKISVGITKQGDGQTYCELKNSGGSFCGCVSIALEKYGDRKYISVSACPL